jgi:hypothetical protein
LYKSSCAIQYEECFTNVLENIVNQTFKEYFDYFMNLFLGGFSVFNDIETPLPKPQLWFNKCQDFGINLNLEKMYFLGLLVGYFGLHFFQGREIARP